jgi:hypothetical protein
MGKLYVSNMSQTPQWGKARRRTKERNYSVTDHNDI